MSDDNLEATQVDAIAHSLRQQHLHHPDAPLIRDAPALFPGSSCSPLEVDPAFLNKPAPARFPKRSTDNSRLARKYSTNFSDSGQSSSSAAKQHLVQGMICSETQCRVWNPPAPAPTDVHTASRPSAPTDECLLEVGDDTDVDPSFQDATIGSFSERSRSGGSLALERHGFPLFRTSKEVALRSHNLVRNRPRMRKRAKLREKPSMPAISAASGLASSTTSTQQGSSVP